MKMETSNFKERENKAIQSPLKRDMLLCHKFKVPIDSQLRIRRLPDKQRKKMKIRRFKKARSLRMRFYKSSTEQTDNSITSSSPAE